MPIFAVRNENSGQADCGPGAWASAGEDGSVLQAGDPGGGSLEPGASPGGGSLGPAGGAGLVVPQLAGPTASGKSGVAMRLASEYGLEIVSADAMQVYRGMDVGTAKATPEERAAVPHHLLDVVDPSEPFSVATYVELAENAIADVLGRGGTPIVVGGTGFYLRALREGLSTLPTADPSQQAPLWEAVAVGRLAELDAELRAASPADAERAAMNPRRLVRSLEVLRATGRPPSAFPVRPPRFAYRAAYLAPGMDVLRPRIRERTARMFERGLVAEVEGLLARYPEQPTALQAIGYKEVVAHVRGEATEAEARAAVTAATTRYAKRQRTWFGAEAPELRLMSTGEDAYERLRAWLMERT